MALIKAHTAGYLILVSLYSHLITEAEYLDAWSLWLVNVREMTPESCTEWAELDCFLKRMFVETTEFSYRKCMCTILVFMY